MEINIKSIPSELMRYPTCGDYWTDENGVLQIRVTEMNKRSMQSVVLHEIVEKFVTEYQGISEKEIDKFDINYENNRTENDTEPGDSPDCIYKDAHSFAIAIEMLLANKLGVDWDNHDNLVIETEIKEEEKTETQIEFLSYLKHLKV